MSPALVQAVVEHLGMLRRCGRPTGPENYLVQNTRGGRMSRQRAGEIVSEAAEQASKELESKGLAPLARTTPHSLRRTYISIELIASEGDVKWVMGQVGHADSKMTMDVYAQVQQRAKRSHGAGFDDLVHEAREGFAAMPTTGFWVGNGHDGEKPTKTVSKRPRRERSKSPLSLSARVCFA